MLSCSPNTGQSFLLHSSVQLKYFYLIKQGMIYHHCVFIFLDFQTRSNVQTIMSCNSELRENSQFAVLWLASHWLALFNVSISTFSHFCEIHSNAQMLLCWKRVYYHVAPLNRIQFVSWLLITVGLEISLIILEPKHRQSIFIKADVIKGKIFGNTF